LTPADDESATGVRYYESSQYLLVYSDGKGGLAWQIQEMPDQTKKRVATPTQIWSKLETKLTFSNGVLATSKDVATASTIPKAVIAAVEKVVSTLAPAIAAEKEANEYRVPAPLLYKIVYVSPTEIQFIGGKTKPDKINVTLPLEAP
jgi:Zn-dependent M32 family carboxypeptidase